ncbi:MAG: hypothetical protein Q9226_005578 [Calogaya cf. arnoldii]
MEIGALDSDFQHSRFPANLNKFGTGTLYQSLPLDAKAFNCRANSDFHGSESLLLHAWAALLHAYVRRDVVCFTILTSPPSMDEKVKVDDLCVCSGPSVTTVARWHAGATSSGNYGTLDFRVDPKSKLRSGESNAGIVFSNTDSLGCNIIEEYNTLSGTAHLKQSTQQVSMVYINFRSCMFTFGAHSSTEDPFSLKKATCLHHLVEDVVQQCPEAEAVCAWDGSLNYRTLNALADATAQQLRALGVKPGVYVPFAYEKSMWAIVACLGILKAGGAFVPIGIHEPDIRLLAILKSIGAHVMVTSRRLKAKFRAFVVNVLVIDANTMNVGSHGATEEPSIVCPNGLAASSNPLQAQPADPVFVLFTSGSTGQPKGMIHNHESISTQWLLQGKLLGYHGARVLQFAAHTFDVFIIDVFTALLFAGCVCIPSEEDRQNNVVGVINKMKADYATLTPSFAGLIEPSEVPTLKTLSIGGEALPQDRVQRWAEKVRLIQIYGPAEVGICLAVDMKPDATPETVGFPLPNCSCWLVDPQDSDCLVPIGATGELLVAGPSLAQGYLNDDAKTHMCFIGAPSWARTMELPFTRFYKTGDLLRHNVDRFDGSYDFVGRKDFQIKLRGQRIEPGEVEYHLGKIAGVAHAMVTMPESGSYAGQLVAVVQTRIDQGYFQTHSPSQITVSTQPELSLLIVRESLSKSMPSYMVPSVYLEVDAIPCVPSMKIDRKLVQSWLNALTGELPMPLIERYAIIAEGATARYLSRTVWRLLEQKHGGQRYDDATPRDFVLQGMGINSIQVISLAMLIKKVYGVKVPTPKLLDPSTTIRHLADYVDFHTRQGPRGDMLHTNGVGKSFDLVHEVEPLCSELRNSLLQGQLGAIPPAGNGDHLQPRNIFLTGATGFLGIAILHNLLEHRRDINIYALIRCPSEHAGLLRLLQALDSQGHWQPAYFSRLFVIPGDLNKDNLGISAANLSRMRFAPQQSECSPATSKTKTVEIDTIIHAAAKVHYSTSYSALKQTNTLSVLCLLLSFAHVPSMQRFIYVSGGEHPHIVSSLADPVYVRTIEEEANGYTQSKVVGEQLVQLAASMSSRGKSIRIVKPGYMIGDAKTGIANQSDFLWRLVKGCVEIGAYDITAMRKWVFVADVQFLAEVVIRGLDGLEKDESNTSFVGGRGSIYLKDKVLESTDPVERVLSGVWFEDIWSILKDDYGYKLEGMETDAWMEQLTKAVEGGGEKHLLFPLLDTLEREGRTVGAEWQSTDSDDGRERALEAVRRNVEYLIGVGFLPGAGAG